MPVVFLEFVLKVEHSGQMSSTLRADMLTRAGSSDKNDGNLSKQRPKYVA